jgi:hypothetical protein
MLTDRLQEVVERAAELPAENQNAIAEVLEDLLRAPNDRPPALRPEVAAAVRRAMRDHADMLE